MGIAPLHPSYELQPLAGISLEATVSCKSASFRDQVLITHCGLSGPAILQISNYWHPDDWLELNLLPDQDLGVAAGTAVTRRV